MSEARRPVDPYPKADLLLRGLARGADFSIAFGLAVGAPIVVGPLLAAGYLAVADGLLHGQSPGKKIFGVRAVIPARRCSAGFAESMQRNAPFAALALFWALPLLWPAFLLVGVPVLGLEAWRAFTDPLGLRFGDLLAETQVVDGKVMVGELAPPGLSSAAPAPPGPATRQAAPAAGAAPVWHGPPPPC
jgi:hypothetical protein